ncbi:hypothetical protein TSUD_323170 [Trifolium subterraneum]|uniref:DUF1664 domain-containing protein n=1 Tax=Trifolium subterraneum TaxID=3900 RepID=A0A2Z6NM64_TRISU|nr:hypothetical protein TSUD_323170 [Trifolium subterraneum]
MALQMAPSSSKVLILVGAGLASSVVLNGGQLSAVIAQLQEVLKGVDDQVKISTAGYDTAVIAAQVRQLAQEIRELSLSRPMTIYNDRSSSGGLASYLLPAAAIGAAGYCYMRWRDWSFSDLMFATKKNLANAVATVSKQLENVHETLASTKRHLTKRLEGLDSKIEEQNEPGCLESIGVVNEVKADLSQIGCDVELINQFISGLEEKLKLAEDKQNLTNSGIWYMCDFVDKISNEPNGRVYKGLAELTMALEENAPKGLQFIAEKPDTVESSPIITKKVGLNFSDEKLSVSKSRVHRAYPVGISVSKGITDLAFD